MFLRYPLERANRAPQLRDGVKNSATGHAGATAATLVRRHKRQQAVLRQGHRIDSLGFTHWYPVAVRSITAIAVVAIILISALEWIGPSTGEGPSVQVLGIAAARSMSVGERASIYGGLRLPQGTFEIDVWTCSGTDCIRTSWVRLRGPGTVWRWVGLEEAPRAREGRVIIRIYDVGAKPSRAVGEWTGHVSLE